MAFSTHPFLWDVSKQQAFPRKLWATQPLLLWLAEIARKYPPSSSG
jgi:hypothetical protein